jgi:hypothetical protein
VRLNPAHDTSGRVDIWLNGTFCGDYQGPMADRDNGARRNGAPFINAQPRFGIYRDWRAETQTIYFDKIMFWNADPSRDTRAGGKSAAGLIFCMGTTTRIAWCDSTFNPWLGCMRVSPACDHCYAAALSWRTGRRDYRGLDLWDPHARRVRTSPDYWRAPLRWNRGRAGRRPAAPSVLRLDGGHLR